MTKRHKLYRQGVADMVNAERRLTRRKRYNLAFAAMLALLISVSGLSLHAVSKLLGDSRRVANVQQTQATIEWAASFGEEGREALAAAILEAEDDAAGKAALERLAATLSHRTEATTRSESEAAAERAAAIEAARQTARERRARREIIAGAAASHAVLTIIFGGFCAISTGLLAGVTINAESTEHRLAEFAVGQLTVENGRLAGKAGRRTAACQALLMACRQPAMIIGVDRRLVACNEAAAALFHLAPPSNGVPAHSTRHDLDEPAPLLSRLLADRTISHVWRGESVRAAEWHWRADGNSKESAFSVFAEPIVGESDRLLGAVVVLVNTTDQRQRERRDVSQAAALDASHEQFDLLVAGLARNWSAADASPAPLRMPALVECGQVISHSMHFQTVDLGELAGDALTHYERAIHKANAVVRVESLPQVTGDPDMLACVLKLLLGRALGHTGELPLLVTISSQFAADETWTITIADTSGLELFWDGRQQETLERDPTVVLCRRLIEKQGGRLWVEAALDEGTCIHFSLAPASNFADREPANSPNSDRKGPNLEQAYVSNEEPHVIEPATSGQDDRLAVHL